MSSQAITTAPRLIQREATSRITATAWLNSGLFGLSLLLVVAVAIPYGTVEPWWIAIYECAVFALGATSIVVNWNSNYSLLPSRLTISACAIAVFVLLQSFTVSADPLETRFVFFKALALITHGTLISRYATNHKRLATVVCTVMALAVASAVFGIARQSLQHNEIGFGLPLLRRDSGFAQFINKNHFALLMEMGLGLAAGLLLMGAIKRQLILFVGCGIALMWVALVLTSSRGALFSMLGQLIFVFVVSLIKTSRKHLIIPAAITGVGVLVVVATAAIWVGGDLMITRLESLSGEIRSEATEPNAGVRRREIWSATWQLAKDQPLMGSGFGAYAVAITKFHKATGKWTPEAAHNDYLESMASGGLIGVSLLLWFAFEFLIRVRPQLTSKNKFQRAVCVGAVTGIFGVLLHSFVDFGVHVTANSVVLVTLIVIATRNFQRELNKGATSQSH